MSKKTHIKLNKKQIKKIYLKYLEKQSTKKKNKKIKAISTYSPYQYNIPIKRKIPAKYKVLLYVRNIFRKIFELLVFVLCTEIYNSTKSNNLDTTSSYITIKNK
jgi:hypothetical protein